MQAVGQFQFCKTDLQYFQLLLIVEMRPKTVHSSDISDNEHSILSNQPFRSSLPEQVLEEVGEGQREPEPQVVIHLKYYQEFKKIYTTSFKLWKEIRKQMQTKDALSARITQIESQLVNLHRPRRQDEIEAVEQQVEDSSKRRVGRRARRTAQQIQRKYYCSAQFCDRCYGSQGSLQQHIKLKHPQLMPKQDDGPSFF